MTQRKNEEDTGLRHENAMAESAGRQNLHSDFRKARRTVLFCIFLL